MAPRCCSCVITTSASCSLLVALFLATPPKFRGIVEPESPSRCTSRPHYFRSLKTGALPADSAAVRPSDLGAETFFREYFASGQPVVLRGAANGSRGMETVDFDFLLRGRRALVVEKYVRGDAVGEAVLLPECRWRDDALAAKDAVPALIYEDCGALRGAQYRHTAGARADRGHGLREPTRTRRPLRSRALSSPGLVTQGPRAVYIKTARAFSRALAPSLLEVRGFLRLLVELDQLSRARKTRALSPSGIGGARARALWFARSRAHTRTRSHTPCVVARPRGCSAVPSRAARRPPRAAAPRAPARGTATTPRGTCRGTRAARCGGAGTRP